MRHYNSIKTDGFDFAYTKTENQDAKLFPG